jgi:uncharacterized protein YqjF (DUF2071 family)
VRAPARQAATLEDTAHRPWPVPDGPWLKAQTWRDLLFAHWAVDGAALARLLPQGVALDRFEGEAYLGITPFALSGLRLRGTLPVPRVSSFLEVNVRTYVTAGGRPGIWFLSLDASSRLAVEAARRLYRLPYHHATMSAIARDGAVDYASARIGAERPYVLEARYGGVGPAAAARPGTLEAFLAERYCLYAVDRGRLCRAEIHHPPWPLQRAQARIELNTMPPDAVPVGDERPLLHYAARQDVLVWSLEPVT